MIDIRLKKQFLQNSSSSLQKWDRTKNIKLSKVINDARPALPGDVH